MGQHDHALQALANGEPIPYADTLRVVLCEGSRAPAQAAQVSRRPPVRSRSPYDWSLLAANAGSTWLTQSIPLPQGYIRNQLGGFFTS